MFFNSATQSIYHLETFLSTSFFIFFWVIWKFFINLRKPLSNQGLFSKTSNTIPRFQLSVNKKFKVFLSFLKLLQKLVHSQLYLFYYSLFFIIIILFLLKLSLFRSSLLFVYIILRSLDCIGISITSNINWQEFKARSDQFINFWDNTRNQVGAFFVLDNWLLNITTS